MAGAGAGKGEGARSEERREARKEVGEEDPPKMELVPSPWDI